jgi:hypothetical protein
MVTKEHFAELLGKIMHNCGLLEFLTTLEIDWLANDSLLSDEIGRLNFVRRINVLGELLHKRTSLPAKEIKSLCKQLRSIADRRNEIAHNPILSDDTNGTKFYIMVARGILDRGKDKRVTEKDLNILLDQTREALTKMHALSIEPSGAKANLPPKASKV